MGHLAVGHFDGPLMAITALAVIVGSQAGARVMHTRMQPRHLKRMFGVVLLLIAGKLAVGLV